MINTNYGLQQAPQMNRPQSPIKQGPAFGSKWSYSFSHFEKTPKHTCEVITEILQKHKDLEAIGPNNIKIHMFNSGNNGTGGTLNAVIKADKYIPESSKAEQPTKGIFKLLNKKQKSVTRGSISQDVSFFDEKEQSFDKIKEVVKEKITTVEAQYNADKTQLLHNNK